ncbi:MAG: hypothetical protein NTZ87_00295 [Candidatus Nomurabacteria bacterium]|nr:hypothetical protein [Candidatus Nomurabacteria bacterium]
MDTSNNIFGNTFLGSKWLSPDYLFNQAVSFFHNLSNFDVGNGAQILSVFHTILFLLAIFFLALISYCAIRLFEIRSKEDKHLKHEIEEYAHHQAKKEEKLQQEETVSKNPQWIKTLGYIFSQHPGDWKLAVIEADTMLESLLDQLGFKGDSLGDKLKGATQEKFKSLSSAWEVHTIRNRIAHEGASFALSQREAKRVIAIYEQIFREFGYI